MPTYYDNYLTSSNTTPIHITLAQAKLYLKMDDISTDDDLITAIIKAAEDQVEKTTNLAIVPKTVNYEVWDVELEDTSSATINLPYKGTISSLVVAIVDTEGTSTTLTINDDYYVKGKNALVIHKTYIDGYKFVITYTTTPDTLPNGLDVVIYKLIADYYENRADDGIQQLFRASNDSLSMLEKYAEIDAWL